MASQNPLRQLSSFLHSISSLRSSTILTFLAAIVVWRVQAITGKITGITDLPVLDLRVGGYTAPEAYDLFRALGSKGHELYRQLNLVDFATPAVFGSLLSIIASPLLRKANLPAILNLMPFLYSFFDIGENLVVRYLLSALPEQQPGLVQLASALTQLKYLGNIPAFGVIVVGLLGWGLKAIKTNARKHARRD